MPQTTFSMRSGKATGRYSAPQPTILGLASVCAALSACTSLHSGVSLRKQHMLKVSGNISGNFGIRRWENRPPPGRNASKLLNKPTMIPWPTCSAKLNIETMVASVCWAFVSWIKAKTLWPGFSSYSFVRTPPRLSCYLAVGKAMSLSEPKDGRASGPSLKLDENNDLTLKFSTGSLKCFPMRCYITFWLIRWILAGRHK